jgi:hypothetical protein
MIKITLTLFAVLLLFACTNKNSPSKGISGMPPCLITIIEKIKSDATLKPPKSVTEYTYKGQPVFYLTMPCCDQYNPVYDGDCNYIGAPDGGITGKGDGKLSDFFKAATNGRVVWENK